MNCELNRLEIENKELLVRAIPYFAIEQKDCFDSFENGEVLFGKKKGRLPAMGWNSWNAFGSGNTERLTLEMAQAMVDLGLRELGYQYVVLDDGCYKPARVNGELSNEEVKFPSGFKALSDQIHGLKLKFGMYNDIGTNLCAGAQVGTCGHEMTDAKTYLDWGVDFLKIDNCYYLWDNATFSDQKNAKYVYTPKLQKLLFISKKTGEKTEVFASKDCQSFGNGVKICKDYVYNIGTYDGTGPEQTPVGVESGELIYSFFAKEEEDYDLIVTYASGEEVGTGSWLQVAVGTGKDTIVYYDDFLAGSRDTEDFIESKPISIHLKTGENRVRFMNHRRQENTLRSYAKLLEGLKIANKSEDIVLSLCEWGKTQPQNWGYKVGDSWRILNDITFQVGADGNPGAGQWESEYTTSICAQYNKAVIMDEFAGLTKGWNDPDMLMIGMNGLDHTMCQSHMTMWCMMNSPLMLGLDLRRVKKGDCLWKIIANEEVIALNQDPLGIPCKRVKTSFATASPDTDYIRDNRRVDILAKPLADGSLAVSFINLSKEVVKKYDGNNQKKINDDKTNDNTKADGIEKNMNGIPEISIEEIVSMIGHKMINAESFLNAKQFVVRDVWEHTELVISRTRFGVETLEACENKTYRIWGVS